MKKIVLKKGLNLTKEALVKLEESQMASVKGQGSSSGANCTCKKHSCPAKMEEAAY